MTAAGVGTRVTRQPQPEERQLHRLEEGSGGGQNNFNSAIDFQVQDRPISAATYQNNRGAAAAASRNNHQRQY